MQATSIPGRARLSPAQAADKARARERRLRSLRRGMKMLGVVSPAVAARAAEAIFRTPPRHVAWEGERAILERGRRICLDVRGTAATGWRWGEGDPVLLVHGWGSTAGRLGSFVAPLEAAGFSVLAFDAPGHGATGGRRSSLPEFLFTIEAAGAAHGPLAGIIGHSLGGAATVLAMGRGLTARRAVLIAPAADPAGYTKLFAELLGIRTSVRERMEGRLVRRFGLPWADFDIRAAARQIAAPALVFHDVDDAEIPWKEGGSVSEAWPGASLVTSRGLGHTRIVHDTDVVARAVAFLAGAESTGAAAL